MDDFNVKPGEFPYPLLDGPRESRYLTWVRNHSNYMAERGFLDYLRIVAVLVRGVLINFLTLLPYLLLTALILYWVYEPLLQEWRVKNGSPPHFFLTQDVVHDGWMKWVQDHLGTKAPFLFAPWAGVMALVWYLLFPMVIRLFKVITHKQSLETGNESSVKLRDKYERTFGAVLLAAIAVALVEVLPLLVHYFHHLPGRRFGFREVAAALLGSSSVAAMSGAGTILAALRKTPQVGKLVRSVIMALLGLLGFLLPLFVVLYVTEYLVYKNETETFTLYWWSIAIVPAVLVLGILLALILGIVKQALKDYTWLVWLFLSVLAVAIVLCVLGYKFQTSSFFVLTMAVEIWLFCWLAVDINLTSVLGLYRDRLASAYLVGLNTAGDVDIEEDINLYEICQYDKGSIAPYHLINVALNLQGSKDIGIRERNSDFFIFSKRYIGGNRTGYCRSESMESVFPQMDLATAMAISAAAASPNMGTHTSTPLIAILTLFNVRLGYWVPNPGPLQNALSSGTNAGTPFQFNDVFKDEMAELQKRWQQVYGENDPQRTLADPEQPTPDNGLVGLAFSGGGIRSATLNLGIAQALNEYGVFRHADYLSTVSGGGYLGSGLSTLMRQRPLGDGPYATVSSQRQGDMPDAPWGTLKDRFAWRVRPTAFLREIRGKLDETHDWVNLSDGGHIENLAAIELLRRQCKVIIIGDGEADPNLYFGSLATLIRYARIDLGIHIKIDLNKIRLQNVLENRRSEAHFAVGTIHYPTQTTCGYLLYLKSSFVGLEDEVVVEYRSRNPAFPHESTADQFFDEGQFEAYRALGQHIAEQVLKLLAPEGGKLSYADLVSRLEGLVVGNLAPDEHRHMQDEAAQE
jgi:hypothetical protein